MCSKRRPRYPLAVHQTSTTATWEDAMQNSTVSAKHTSLWTLLVMVIAVWIASLAPMPTLAAESAPDEEPASAAGVAVEYLEPNRAFVKDEPICRPIDTDISGSGNGDVVPAATGTWSFLGNESCFDICGSSCSIFCPNPKCSSANPTGQPCSPLGSYCYYIPTGSNYAKWYGCF